MDVEIAIDAGAQLPLSFFRVTTKGSSRFTNDM